jgi:thiosulfate dehydrogenase (quinone) large subunit
MRADHRFQISGAMMVIRVNTDYQLRDPKVATLLFGDTRMSTVWLLARLYLGWQWLDAGRQKVTSDAWMDGGQALRAYWEQVVAGSGSGGTEMTASWYRDLIRFLLDNGWYDWCGKAIAVSEVVIGVALILGLLAGIAAFMGSLLTFSMVLGGVTSANPLVFIVALGVIAAWKVAGYIGLDAFVLPKLGAPWHPGVFWKRIRPGRRSHPADASAKDRSVTDTFQVAEPE